MPIGLFIGVWIVAMTFMFGYKDGPKHDKGFFDDTPAQGERK